MSQKIVQKIRIVQKILEKHLDLDADQEVRDAVQEVRDADQEVRDAGQGKDRFRTLFLYHFCF